MVKGMLPDLRFVIGSILATVVLGLAGTFTVLGQKPAPVLRAL